MLQKLESLYGSLIRLLTALLTLTLLAVCIMALVNWQRATAKEEATPKAAVDPAPPKVSSDDIIKRVVANQLGQSVDPIRSNDPNAGALERIGKSIRAFADKHPSDEYMSADDVIASARDKVNDQDTPALKAAYATGLADALEHSLANAKIEALVIKHAPHAAGAEDVSSADAQPMEVVRDVISQFDDDFSEQVTMTSHLDDDRDTQADRKRSEAWSMLMRVGGPLLLLMLVLQLLTFGRIEQNTRRLGSQDR